MAVPPQFQKAHDRMAGKKPTPLSPQKGQGGPLSSIASTPKKGDADDKKKQAMLAAFKGRH
jgi:hypothetical protein